MEDNAIVELYFARSEQAIRETEQKYGAYLNTIATNILHLPEDAEETVSDTYLAALEPFPQPAPGCCGISSAASCEQGLSALQLSDRRQALRGDRCFAVGNRGLSAGRRQDTTRRMEQRVITQSINAFLGSLSREEQGIFTARYFYAVPLEQIAETYGNSLRQIQYRLQKMRTSLRKRLEQEGIAV